MPFSGGCVTSVAGRPCVSGLWLEAVADSAHSQQVDGIRRVRLEIAPQANDEVIDRPRVGVLMDVPDVFQNVFARDDLYPDARSDSEADRLP